MAQVTYVDGIHSVRGALDSAKEAQENRARWISRLRWQGENSIAPDGSIWHEFYRMHMHEGAWSERATRNRNLIKAAQRAAHDIEHICNHPEQNYDPALVAMAQSWQQRYADYRATFPPDSKTYKHFFGWMFTEIYRELRKESEFE